MSKGRVHDPVAHCAQAQRVHLAQQLRQPLRHRHHLVELVLHRLTAGATHTRSVAYMDNERNLASLAVCSAS